MTGDRRPKIGRAAAARLAPVVRPLTRPRRAGWVPLSWGCAHRPASVPGDVAP